MINSNSIKRPGPRASAGRLRIRLLFVVFIAATFGAIALSGWRAAYSTILERGAPVITVTDVPRGIGVAPVSFDIRVEDPDSGLDEIVVRTRQRSRVREHLRRKLDGVRATAVRVDFPGERSDLEEGTASLEIRVFDRSFWSNAAEKIIPLRIDYRRPAVEAVSGQHNARVGGAQLIVYRAIDEDLAISGVRVGRDTFIGFPARSFDPELTDAALHMALYAIAPDGTPEAEPRLFAEDQVGNVVARSFPGRVLRRPERNVNITVSNDFLRQNVSDLADANYQRLARAASLAGRKLEYDSSKGSDERLIEKFKLVNEDLRKLDERELVALLRSNQRFDRYWQAPFARQPGTPHVAFGDKITFKYADKVIGQLFQTGYEISLARDRDEVFAVADGIVVLSENIGTYGRVLAVDHGLGLATVYGRLDRATVAKGDKVSAGQSIGIGGRSGFARTTQVYFETRVHGVAVDPREWWDRNWFRGHITEKINQAKRLLGLQVFVPLQ